MFEALKELFQIDNIIFYGVIILGCYVFNVFYKKTTYYQITGNSYLKVILDKGLFGEYRIFKYLQFLEKQGAKFLFNVYIPKENGETTEIDVLMICPRGIFVFESKNYSGWIFGSESQQKWTQTLPQGKGKSQKNSFYNPIKQNASHIKHLSSLLSDKFLNVPMFNIVVFSERCTLKKITVDSPDVKVIKRDKVTDCVGGICKLTESVLSDSDINEIHMALLGYSQVSDEVKQKHIENIRK